MGIRYNVDAEHDLLFQREDWMFSYRVGGLLYRDGKLLMQRTMGENSYSIPGGHVSFGEFSRETLARELIEETGAAIKVGRLAAVVELFWQWRKPCHQVNFYYLAELKNKDALPSYNFFAMDELGQQQKALEFCWVDLKQLHRVEIQPACLKPYLAQLPDHIIHLQENQLEG
ncbi:MAG: NUDIX domain-containing protein [Clostridia bacterium]|nr:NUDIX domain-containing protein [Clostridia bacterium]